MPNVRKLQESQRCGKRCDKQSNAIIDAVARKLNKENTSENGRTNKNRQEHRNNKLAEMKSKVILTNVIWPIKTDKRSDVEDPRKT